MADTRMNSFGNKTIKYLLRIKKALVIIDFLQLFWFILPRKTVRRSPRAASDSPWREISGSLFIPGNLSASRLCLQKIDMRSGALKRKLFKGNGHGHSVLCSPSGSGWLIPENGLSIIEFDLKTLRQTGAITAGDTMIGGHAALSGDGNRLYYVDRGMNDGTLESSLVVYDLNRKKTINKFEKIGIYPHDVLVDSSEQHAIVASYGRTADFVGAKNTLHYSESGMDLRRPSFATVDLRNGHVKGKCAFDESFMLAHIALDEEGKCAYVQGTNFLLFSQGSSETVSSVIKQRGVPLTLEERARGWVFTPGVQLKVDLNDGRVIQHLDYHFCRPQSIVFSRSTGMVFASFGISNKVVRYDKETMEAQEEFDFSGLGNADPRGLALSSDERFLFVSGRAKNIYCLDLHSLARPGSQVMHLNNYCNSHITFFSQPAAQRGESG